MNREIKFRVWDTQQEEMLDEVEVDYLSLSNLKIQNSWRIQMPNSFYVHMLGTVVFLVILLAMILMGV